LWYDVLGLKSRVVDTVKIEKENVVEDIVQLGSGQFAVEVDLMTPIDPSKSPKVHVPPLNHVGLWVDDLDKAVNWMSNVAGVRFTPGGIRKGAAGHNVAFIHPKGKTPDSPVGGNGVLIELVQAPPDVVAAYNDAEAKAAAAAGKDSDDDTF